MSSWIDSQKGLNTAFILMPILASQGLLIIVFSVLFFLLIGTSLYFLLQLQSQVMIYGLPLLCLYSGYVFYCWQSCFSLKYPNSVCALFCDGGNWSLKRRNNQLIEGLELTRYFLSSHYLVLHFTKNERIFPKLLMSKKHSVMIFPSQLGEEKYRQLYRSLKYQDKSMFNV